MSRVSPARAPSMGFLRSIESGIERVVDGTVGRVVRVSVQPVEIARKLAKELEDGKVQSGGRTLVPSLYTVYLPPKDRERFAEYEASLRVELGAYLAEHVRREGYSVLARPRVTFETAEELASGTFGIATERESFSDVPPARTVPVDAVPEPPAPVYEPVQEALPEVVVEPEPEILPEPELEPEPAAFEPDPDLSEDEPASAGAPSPVAPAPSPPDLPGFSPPPAPFLPVPTPPVPTPPVFASGIPDVAPDPPVAAPLPEPEPEPEPEPGPRLEFVPPPIEATQSVSAAEAARAGLAHAADALVVDGHRHPLTGPVTVIGRSSACDVPLDDASASRRHAELRRRGGKTVLVDLDSTNGTLVNGRRVREAPLRAGDRITIGTTTIVFERAS